MVVVERDVWRRGRSVLGVVKDGVACLGVWCGGSRCCSSLVWGSDLGPGGLIGRGAFGGKGLLGGWPVPGPLCWVLGTGARGLFGGGPGRGGSVGSGTRVVQSCEGAWADESDRFIVVG